LGDVLVVTGFDRRPAHPDLLNVLEAVKQAGGGFRSLEDAWCDSTTPHSEGAGTSELSRPDRPAGLLLMTRLNRRSGWDTAKTRPGAWNVLNHL
jgi:hypothetical protein